MLEIKAIGEMYVDGGKKGYISKEFKETFLIHDKFNEGNMPNVVIQKMLVNGRLRQNHEDFEKIKTCDAMSYIKSSKKNVKYLSWEELEDLEMQDLREYSAAVGLLFKGSVLGRPMEMRKKIWEETESMVGKKEKPLESKMGSRTHNPEPVELEPEEIEEI